MPRSSPVEDRLVPSKGATKQAAAGMEQSPGVFRSAYSGSCTKCSLRMLNTPSRRVQGHPSNSLADMGKFRRPNRGEALVSGSNAAGSSGTVAKASFDDTLSRRLRGVQTLEDVRRSKREYMRQWRADPLHRTQDWMNRLKWHYQRKLRSALGSTGAMGAKRGRAPLCGFCHQLPAITTVKRLKCCEVARGGFVEEQVLYCGEC